MTIDEAIAHAREVAQKQRKDNVTNNIFFQKKENYF